MQVTGEDVRTTTDLDESLVVTDLPVDSQSRRPVRLADLRPLKSEDLAQLAFLHLGGSGPEPGTPAGHLWLASLGGLNARVGGGWAIVRPGEPRAVGLIVYHAVDERQEAAIVSYALELEARGRGLGAAAVGQAVERLLGDIGFKTLFADVELINAASRCLLHKVGFDALTPGATPGVQVAPDRPAQRWRMGHARNSAGRSIINLGAVGPL